MPLNGYPVTGDGEVCTEMAAQDAGNPLPLRPARAAANDKMAWKPPGPVVSPKAADGDTSMLGDAPRGKVV